MPKTAQRGTEKSKVEAKIKTDVKGEPHNLLTSPTNRFKTEDVQP